MKINLAIFSVIFFIMSCAQNNLFSEMASKNSDDALLFDAQVAVNQQRYDDAIAIVLSMSALAQTNVATREVLASGYAGKCGLNFLDYTGRLAAANTGSAFHLMSDPFVGVAVSPADCLTSLQTIDLIGTKAQRTLNQNAFAAVVGMVLLGSATRFYTDDNPVGGDGVQDAVGISCGLTNAQIDNVVLGYAYMATNFDALSTSQIGASSSTAISDSINVCSTVAGAACTNTDPALITNPIRDTMKDLLNTADYGVGLADGSNPLLIPVSCP
ncbi:MAG: hypothetical protein ABL930_07980 [Pseudobdellovibrio sp.]